MTIGERIKLVRTTIGKTQQVFADSIGLKRNTIANYEIGQVQPSDRTISDICREFSVSEVWLRTGEGEMFLPVSDDQQLVDILTRMEVDQGDAFVHTLTAALKAYYRLDDGEKRAVKKLLQETLENLQQKSTPE